MLMQYIIYRCILSDSSSLYRFPSYCFSVTLATIVRTGGQKVNISQVLDSLLEGYDKRLRPGFGGEALTVNADISLRSMGPISELNMIYTLDCYFRQRWMDHRLAMNVSLENLTLGIKILERIWHPDTVFYNGQKSYLHAITSHNRFLRIAANGTVLFSQRLTIQATCRMHLENFPMDIQHCPLLIGSCESLLNFFVRSSTTVLTMTILGIENKSQLPKVSYITALDVYVALCFVFVIATTIEFAVVHYFTKFGTGEPMVLSSDEDSSVEEISEDNTSLDSLTLENGKFKVHNYPWPPGEVNVKVGILAKLCHCLTRTKDGRGRMKGKLSMFSNSVSQVDRAARVLFPLTFTVLNVIYCVSYYLWAFSEQ
ncbi:gamma-aminobutyric acid receptor alpha-like [Aplysia californica]|uniref:Gamma-aminobutyric acid receptor alpha-like n=1 Tax=Aplysia californica TaxID=6500 RepID=A0ABM0ZX07_APLCA|nr:gamma-aminobutyric acid receptor alpha-like [Aplysia californica]